MEKDKNHLNKEQIAIYAEALASDTPVNLPDDIKRHVKYCKECTSEIHIVSEILREKYKNSIADGLNSINKPKKISSGTWFAVAASIIIIAALGYLFSRSTDTPDNNLMAIDSTLFNNNNIANTYDEFNNNLTDTNVVIAENNIIDSNAIDSIIPKKNDLAIAYITNQEMEKLVSRFKDASMRSEDISVLTPASITFTKKDSINLNWNNTNNQYLTVEVFDNNGNKVVSKASSRNQVTITEISKSGLYYWKLINEDYDLLFCGRIKYNR